MRSPSDIVVGANRQLEAGLRQPREVDLGEGPVPFHDRLEARQGLPLAGGAVVPQLDQELLLARVVVF